MHRACPGWVLLDLGRGRLARNHSDSILHLSDSLNSRLFEHLAQLCPRFCADLRRTSGRAFRRLSLPSSRACRSVRRRALLSAIPTAQRCQDCSCCFCLTRAFRQQPPVLRAVSLDSRARTSWHALAGSKPALFPSAQRQAGEQERTLKLALHIVASRVRVLSHGTPERSHSERPPPQSGFQPRAKTVQTAQAAALQVQLDFSVAQNWSQAFQVVCVAVHCTSGARPPQIHRGISCMQLWCCLAILAS